MYIYIYIFMQPYIYTYPYMYTYIYTYTYICIHIYGTVRRVSLYAHSMQGVCWKIIFFFTKTKKRVPLCKKALICNNKARLTNDRVV